MYAAADRAPVRRETRTTTDRPLRCGDPVEVQNRLTGAWSAGFEVAEVVTDAPKHNYLLRRSSDGAVLPAHFDGEAVRPRH